MLRWKKCFSHRLTIDLRIVIITNTLCPERFVVGAGGCMVQFFQTLCTDEQGQDIAEYAVMLAVILVLVIGTVRLIGGNANNAFSSVASSLGTQ
jgi:Flp pilus assembly pilin Flp